MQPDSPATQRATAVFYDVSGRPVRTLLDETIPAGMHRVERDGRNYAGREVPSGIYLLRVRAVGFEMAKRVVRMQ